VKSAGIVESSLQGGYFFAYDLGKKIKESLGVSSDYIEMQGKLMWVERDKDEGHMNISFYFWAPNLKKKEGIYN
jgi:hypothetical protein